MVEAWRHPRAHSRRVSLSFHSGLVHRCSEHPARGLHLHAVDHGGHRTLDGVAVKRFWQPCGIASTHEFATIRGRPCIRLDSDTLALVHQTTPDHTRPGRSAGARPDRRGVPGPGSARRSASRAIRNIAHEPRRDPDIASVSAPLGPLSRALGCRPTSHIVCRSSRPDGSPRALNAGASSCFEPLVESGSG